MKAKKLKVHLPFSWLILANLNVGGFLAFYLIGRHASHKGGRPKRDRYSPWFKSCKKDSKKICLEVVVKTTAIFLSGAAVGASLMYLADPRLGKRRRAIARDAGVHNARVIGRRAIVGSRDIGHRLKGVFAKAKGLFKHEPVDDAILNDRVRTEIGRFSSHPNVEVIVENGFVTLLGPIVNREERSVLKAARSVRGVCGIVNRMKPYEPLQNMARREQQSHIMQSHWAPATRIIVGTIGFAAVATGIKVGSDRRTLARIAGLALAVRAATKRLMGLETGKRSSGVVRKTA